MPQPIDVDEALAGTESVDDAFSSRVHAAYERVAAAGPFLLELLQRMGPQGVQKVLEGVGKVDDAIKSNVLEASKKGGQLTFVSTQINDLQEKVNVAVADNEKSTNKLGLPLLIPTTGPTIPVSDTVSDVGCGVGLGMVLGGMVGAGLGLAAENPIEIATSAAWIAGGASMSATFCHFH